jgi:tetratricopeptide (TPR) repeat protein
MKQLALLSVLALTACEEPQQAEARTKVQTTIDYVAHGRAELSAGRPEQAVIEFKKAINATPEDVSNYLLLAEAYRLSGNEAAAALSLKQAEAVSGTQDPSIRRQRAALLRKMHQTKAAIVELIALRDEDLLTDPEILDLARLLAHRQRIDEAFKTLERIQMRSPDDPEAKVLEAEILFVKGDDVVAAKIIDRLLTENPALTSARLLRARYFFNARELAQAEQDLAMIDSKDSKREDVLALRAQVLNELGRSEEAAALLEELVNENPKDAEIIALLAETRLEEGKGGEAQVLVDKVLAVEPRWARALYVRGRAVEMQERYEDALADYQSALLTDSTFTPALKRVWRVQKHLNNKPESMATLEQLFFQNELDTEEKVQLATYYAETWANVDRGEKLITEVLKKDPTNKEYLAIKAKLSKGAQGLGIKKKNTGGIQVIKGGRR